MVGRGIDPGDADRIAGKMVEKNAWIAVLRLPTGFGKSTSSPIIFNRLHGLGLADRMIHVLPLRAIVEDLYVRFLCSEAREDLRGVYEALIGAGIGRGDIAFQSGDLLLKHSTIECREGESYSAKKDPLFDSRAVITTLDSFMMNLMKIPVAEVFKAKRHYASPLARIFVSAVFLDEAHYVSGDPRSIASTKLLAEYAQNARVPLILMSATIGRNHIEKIVGNHLKAITACLEGDRIGGRCDVEIDGKEFIEKASSISWRIRMIDEDMVVDKAAELVGIGKRVLILVRSVKRSAEIYRRLRERGVESRLLHAGLTLRDRGEVLSDVRSMLETKRGFALVATPVINAGVDMSFDAAIVEAADFTSIIQICGRVCRSELCGDAEVFIVAQRSSKYVLDEIDKLKNIDLRIPFDIKDRKGYAVLLEIDASNTDIKGVGREILDLFGLFYPFYVSQKDITKYLLENMGSPARRSLLIQVFIDPGRDGIELRDVLGKMITVDAWDVKRCREYADSYLEIAEENGELVVRENKEAWERIRMNLEHPLRLYRSLFHARTSGSRYVVAGGILIRGEGYDKEAGLLCIQEGGEG
ncbi:CRISPR-associated helicase Cas3 [Desulfurococcaceae archaeon AG1]|nr:CRISPR-associated helicase Cas3 [Desulfurococcaceae archaeon AG1]